MRMIYPTKKAFSRFYFYFSELYTSGISSLQFCSAIIHQIMPKNLIDSIRMEVSNHSFEIREALKYWSVDWLVVLGLTALWDSISVYIGPSPKEREKEKRKNR